LLWVKGYEQAAILGNLLVCKVESLNLVARILEYVEEGNYGLIVVVDLICYGELLAVVRCVAGKRRFCSRYCEYRGGKCLLSVVSIGLVTVECVEGAKRAYSVFGSAFDDYAVERDRVGV
jgi:hypothetical protein